MRKKKKKKKKIETWDVIALPTSLHVLQPMMISGNSLILNLFLLLNLFLMIPVNYT
jgi:hypothetical protein